MFFKRYFFLFICLLPAVLSLKAQHVKVKGVTLVASPEPVHDDAFHPISGICADWVALNPFAFSRSERSPDVIYDHPRQWWGERSEGVNDAIVKARRSGMKIMLKPQVWIPNGWVGNVEFQDLEVRRIWQDAYTSYILIMAEIAATQELDLFCIGTEYDQTVINDMSFWSGLIAEVRKIYDGPLTYAANWTHYAELDIWKDLDYIGIDAYFPLSDKATPGVEELKTAWTEKAAALRAFSHKQDKHILFTEFGYMSIDGCAHEHWELEPKRNSIQANEQAQANAYKALLETFMPQDWWAGGFIWKWYPDTHSALGEGQRAHDYTPQGKMAETILRTIFGSY